MSVLSLTMSVSGELTVFEEPVCEARRVGLILQSPIVTADREFSISEPGIGSAAGFLLTNF
jgi:hypothetical protein